MNAALMQADLAKLPIWSGDITKDGYDVEQWVDRVDRAAGTANWNDEDTMSYVYNAFRGSALKWLGALKTFNINTKSWAAVRTELLDAYSRVQTTRTTVVNLTDLKQLSNESITDFGSRVASIIEDIKQLMPVASKTPQGITWAAEIRGLAGFNDVAAAIKAKQLQDVADQMVWNSFDHLGIQLFVSNLKPVIRDELMKTPPATLNATIKMARSLEKIHAKSDHSHAAVSEVQHQSQQPQHHNNADNNLLDAEIEALSAQFQALLKRRNGNGNGNKMARGNGQAQRGQRGRGRGGRGGNSTGYNVCRYCKKPGHLQKVCNSRIKAGAPEVDAQGKPYTHANELDEDNGTTADGQPHPQHNPWASSQPPTFNWESLQEIYPGTPDFI